MIVSPVSSLTVTYGYVIAVWSIRWSMVIAWPGSSVVPQRKPGENAICAFFSASSASRISWSDVPLKLPRRYSRPSVVASFSSSFAAYCARTPRM